MFSTLEIQEQRYNIWSCGTPTSRVREVTQIIKVNCDKCYDGSQGGAGKAGGAVFVESEFPRRSCSMIWVSRHHPVLKCRAGAFHPISCSPNCTLLGRSEKQPFQRSPDLLVQSFPADQDGPV